MGGRERERKGRNTEKSHGRKEVSEIVLAVQRVLSADRAMGISSGSVSLGARPLYDPMKSCQPCLLRPYMAISGNRLLLDPIHNSFFFLWPELLEVTAAPKVTNEIFNRENIQEMFKRKKNR